MKQLPEHGSCFICGSENPHNVGLRWYVDEKGVVSSEFTLTTAQQGPPGYAHSGQNPPRSGQQPGLDRMTNESRPDDKRV
ncbi:MAG: hypothetical protein Kow002_10740 [Anaerolineales bacterium]